MHHKTKKKLLEATKLYLVEPEDNKTIEIKIQLPYSEYVSIFLHEPINQKVIYRSLNHGGFNYDPTKDTPITKYRKKQIIKILENSIDYRSNSTDTINLMIDLVNSMNDYI